VYTRSGDVWSQQAKLVGTDAVGALQRAVSLSADGNTAIVGGPGDHGNSGAAWVFTRAAGVWSQQAKLVGTGAVNAAEQGVSVTLSGDGDTAIVGGPSDNSSAGAVWVFRRSGGAWSQQERLVGMSGIGDSLQGSSVSLSTDGNTAIVGAPNDNNRVGAAWVYAQPVFAGTPGKANCYGQSVAGLAPQFGGLNAAASALGFPDVSALQNGIVAFCGG
jgi:hypothetical protein